LYLFKLNVWFRKEMEHIDKRKHKGVVMNKLGEIIAKWKLDSSVEEEIMS